MKIAFVGKGGSGKSTVSWLITHVLSHMGKKVLAIDADYNMDLAQNIGVDTSWKNFLHDAEPDFYRYLGLTQKDHYVDLPDRTDLRKFRYAPPADIDEFTMKYASPLRNVPGVSLMVMGTVNEESLYGHRCSHAYITSIKYYLPLLDLSDEAVVVIDSVAGTDMVGYGLYLGVDAIVTVVEPTVNSIGVYRQIRRLAEEFRIPIFAIGNKGWDEDSSRNFASEFGGSLLGNIPIDPAFIGHDFDGLSEASRSAGRKISEGLLSYRFDPALQWERHREWKRKYDRQLEVSQGKEFMFLADDAKKS